MHELRSGALVLLMLINLALLIESQDPIANCQERDLSQLPAEGRRCRKICTAKSDCAGSKICRCDNICGMSCFNPNASCALEDIENGSHQGGTRYGQFRDYECMEGFLLIGESRRVCQSDRYWSGPTPRCVAVCIRPAGSSSAFPDATKEVYFVDETLTFVCRTGYSLNFNSNPVITCQSNSQWTPFRFTCERVSCGNPGFIRHGLIEGDDYRFGSQVTVRCNIGYNLISPGRANGRMSCFSRSSRGVWSPDIDEFECQIVRCFRPENPENGIVDTGGVEYTYGQVVTYRCSTGYKIVGNSEGICNENRTWGPLPVCDIDDDCDFEELQRRTCGYRSRGSPGWIRTFTNNVRFGFRGYVVRATLTSSQVGLRSVLFSPMIPRETMMCLRFYYNVSQIRNGNEFALISVENNLPRQNWSFNHRDPRNEWLGTDILFSSADGPFQIEFTVIKDAFSSVIVEVDDISVHPSNGTDCVNECASSPCLNGGECLNRIGRFECYCRDGYEGDNCAIEIRCEVPNLPADRNVQPIAIQSVFYDEVLTYRCIDGFKIRRNVFSLTVRCRNDRSFPLPPPICVAIRCNIPAAAGGLLIMPEGRVTVRYNRDITYECMNGYLMNGRPENTLTVTCLRNERFSAGAPTCTEIECKLPSRLRFGTITRLPGSRLTRSGYLGFESRLRYNCNVNYEMLNQLSGMLIVTCTENGWTDPLPVCALIECDVPQPDKGQVISNNAKVRVDTRLTYRCNNGYSMDGTFEESIRVTCQNNKQFSPALPDCLLVECAIPEAPGFGIIDGTSFATPNARLGDQISYVCIQGFWFQGIRQTSVDAVCMRNHQFSRSAPGDCEAITCSLPETSQTVIPSNAKQTWSIGEEISFSCVNDSYSIDGESALTCEDDGSWSFPTPLCQKITCLDRRTPQFARQDPDGQAVWRPGDQVTYTCSNTVLDGNASATCEASGQWSHPLPICIRNSCPEPNVNSFILYISNPRSTWYSDDSIQYACAEGFILSGNSNLTCLSDGTWSSEVPQCQENELDCPINYTLEQPFCFDAVNKDMNYTEAKNLCLADDATLPILRSEGVQEKLTNFTSSTANLQNYWIGIMYIQVNVIKWDTGETFKLQTTHDRFLDGRRVDANKTCSILRQRTGEWLNHYCTNERHTVCMKWSSNVKPLIVTSVSLPQLDGQYYPENGKLENGAPVYKQLNPSGTIHFLYRELLPSNNTGGTPLWYFTSGPISSTPLVFVLSQELFPQDVTKRWINGSNSQQIEIRLQIDNTDRWGNWSDWSSCSNTCGEGMQLSTRRCLDGRLGSLYCRGLMVTTRPCVVQNCLGQCLIPSVQNSDRSAVSEATEDEGNPLTITCNDGFLIEGMDTSTLSITCQGNDEWSPNVPQCIEMRCNIPNGENTQAIRTQDIAVGENFVYNCLENYYIKNNLGTISESVSCINSNGQVMLNPIAIPACQAIRCIAAAPNANSQEASNADSFEVGDNLTYECSNGYHINGNASSNSITTTCEADNGRGGWSLSPPFCEGAWSEWTNWDDCTQSCGDGTRLRSRNCRADTPAECSGLAMETEACNDEMCQAAALWSGWTQWSGCTSTCGGGRRGRSRSCSTGVSAECRGSGFQTGNCNPDVCPSWSRWSGWGGCSGTCGRGLQTRARSCSGSSSAQCEGDDRESQSCNNVECPTPGGVENSPASWGNWTNWSMCSRACDGGLQRRSRECLGSSQNQNDCFGLATGAQPCNTRTCVYDETTIGLTRYRHYRIAVNFAHAETECTHFGGTLAIIKSAAVNTRLTSLIQQVARHDFYVYIGMEGINRFNWKYADETKVALRGESGFQRWQGGEPNNFAGNEQCGCMTFISGSWNDINCERSLFFICERAAGCNAPDPLQFSTIDPSGPTTFDVNQIITYRCDNGYEITGTTQTELASTCLSDGSWSKNPPQCATINPCNSNPCVNEGTCQPNGGLRFLCLCPVEAAGDRCELINDLCISSPCQNGGTCSGNRLSYECACTSTFGGQNCESSICSIDPSRIPTGVVISNRNNDEVYQLGVQLPIGCSDPEAILAARVQTITCASGDIWQPSITDLRCI